MFKKGNTVIALKDMDYGYSIIRAIHNLYKNEKYIIEDVNPHKNEIRIEFYWWKAEDFRLMTPADIIKERLCSNKEKF